MIGAEAPPRQKTVPPGEERPLSDPHPLVGITRNVLALGIVSFFGSVAVGMVAPVRVIFLVMVLYIPLPIVGLIEGAAMSVQLLARAFSPRSAHRSLPLTVGIVISVLAKPLLALVATWPVALSLVSLDHAGRGMVGNAGASLLASSALPEYRRKAYLFHHRVGMYGVVAGALATFLLLLLVTSDLRAVFVWTAIPGLLALVALMVFHFTRSRTPATGIALPDASVIAFRASRFASPALGVRFWMFAASATVLSLGTLSEAFLVLRTAALVDSIPAVVLVYLVYRVAYALLSSPLGRLAERWTRLPVLITGYGLLALIYAGAMVAVEAWNAWALFLAYAAFRALTAGVLEGLVGDLVPPTLQGSALRWLMLLVGFAALPANAIAGWFWVVGGASAGFGYALWAVLVGLGLMVAWLPWLRRGFPE